MSSKGRLDKIKNSIDESSFLVNDESFLLPDMGQYYQGAVDNPYVKMVDEAIRGVKEGDVNKASFYIEEPYFTRLGAYDLEGVYFVKVRPDISKEADEIGYFDGDTIYWPASTMKANGHEERISNSVKNATAVLEGRTADIGLRFLGIDAPETPKYSIEYVDLSKENTTSFTFAQLSKMNRKIYFYERGAKKKDSDKVNFIKIGNLWKQYELSNRAKDEKGRTAIKVLQKEGEKDPKKLAAGLKAKKIVKDLINKAGGDVYVMIDRTSLSRSSEKYPALFDADPFAEDTIGKLKYWWSQILDYNKYRYAGYNQWGQDNHGRFLGTPYVKITDSTGTKWINIAKYLIAEVPEIVIFPDYQHSPLYEDNFGFASRIFKLHTYDYKNRMLADQAEALANLFDDRRKIQKEIFKRDFDELKDWTVTIGDCTLFVPPTSIRSITQTTNERVPVVRAKGSITKGAMKAERLLEMTIYFNDERGINGYEYEAELPNKKKVTYYMNGLRALIAQFKFTPFLPVESHYINEVLNIEAVTLVNLQISTLPDYPKCIAAVLTLQEFDYLQYMSELPVNMDENDTYRNMFSSTINFEVMRWYYQRAIRLGEDLKNVDVNSAEYLEKTQGHRTALVPMKFERPNIRFLIANEDHLQRMLQIKLDAIRSPHAKIILSDTEKEVAKDISNIYVRLSNLLGDKEFKKQLDDLNWNMKKGSSDRVGVVKTKNEIKSSDSLKGTGLRVYRGADSFWGEVVSPKEYEKTVNRFLSYVRKEMLKVNNEVGKTILTGGTLVYREKNIEKIKFNVMDEHYERELEKIQGDEYERKKQYVSGNVILGVEFKVNLEYLTNDSMIEDLRRDASLTTQIEMKEVFKNRTIFIPFRGTFETDKNASFLHPYVMTQEAYGFKIEAMNPDVQFLSYCYSIATALGYNNGRTINEEAADLKQAIDMDTLETIVYENYDIGDVRIKNLSCGFGNVFTRVGLNGKDGYAPQYMGGQDAIIEIGIETTAPESVGLINALPRIATEYARNYRLVLPASPLKLDSEITKLLGVNEVVIENVEVDTVPNQPGLYSISMRLISMDRTLRNREGLKKINEFSHAGKKTNDTEKQIEMNTYFDLNKTLAQAEIYPDLELPTLEELDKNNFFFIRHLFETGRKYPDPDFYFVYGHVLQSQIFREAIENYRDAKMEEMNWVDSEGGKITTKAQKDMGVKVTDANSKAKNWKNFFAITKEVNAKMPKELNLHKSKWDIINILRASQVNDAWDISEDIKVIFLEPAYLSLVEHHDQLSKAPSEKKELERSAGEWVVEAMKPAKEASKLIRQYLLNKKPGAKMLKYDPRKQSAYAAYASQKTIDESLVSGTIENLLRDSEVKTIFEKLGVNINSKFKKALKNIIWASACAATSEKEYTGKKSDVGWQPNKNFVGLKVSSSQDASGTSLANNDKEIVEHGIEFGPYRIKMYTREEIKNITGDNVPFGLFGKEDNEADLNKTHFLLDPYYRKSSTKMSEIKEYKLNAAKNVSFATEAYFRLMLLWMKRLIDDNILPNMSFDVLKDEFERELKTVQAKKYYGIEGDTDGFDTEVDEIKKYLDFLNKSERAVDGGKVFAAAVLALTGSEGIYEPIKNRRYDMLNGMVQSAMSMSGDHNPTDMDYILLRKFLLALVGCGQIKKETDIGQAAQNPITDFKKALNEKKYIEAAEDPMTYIKHSFYDMVVNDKRGRMARAFPAFYVVFVDEGREIGLWKLHDNFYNINSISEIQVSKSRKNPADTCRIVMSNLFHTFTTDDEDSNVEYEYDWRDVFTSIFNPKAYFIKEEAKRLKQQPLNRAKLTPGTRIHVRMGYGANASSLPVLFNGQIAEISAGEVVEIIAQGDGTQLMNPILDNTEAHEKENQDKFWKFFQNLFSAASTPKKIIDAFLTVEGGFWKKKGREWTNGYYGNDHPLGITHFGNPRYDVVFKAGEPTQNIFEAINRPKWADLGSEISGEYSLKEAPKITMDVFGKTFWDVLNVCASASPDYVVGVVPFGFRSTIFHGHPRYYYAYEYFEDTDGTILERRKPFQQYHIYTSYSDIIKNDIKASSRDVRTNAIGLYRLKKAGTRESQEKTGTLWVDYDIYPEEQKSMIYDTQLWAKGVPVGGAIIPFLNVIVNATSDDKGVVQSGKAIAWRMTANALKESVKDMYTGELIVIGDPSVKPHDRMFIYDTYENMSGGALVEGCVHNFSADTGYTTTIYPDAIAVVDDRHELAVQSTAGAIVGQSLLAYIAVITPSLIFGKTMTPILSMTKKQIGQIAKGAYKLVKSTGALNTAQKIAKSSRLAKKAYTTGRIAVGAGAAAIAGSGGTALIPLAALALEMSIMHVASKGAYNVVERWMASKQVLQVFPLKKNQKVLTAGLNGSTGLVVGSPTYDKQGAMKSLFAKLDTETNGFGRVTNFMIDFLATDEMKRIAARYVRGQDMPEQSDATSSREKVIDGTLEGLTEEQARKAAGYRRMLLSPRFTPDSSDYNDRIDHVYNSLAFLDTKAIEIQPRITSETVYVKDDEKLKEAMKKGVFKIIWDSSVPEGLYEFLEFNIAGKPEQVRAGVIKKGSKKIYDIPFLRPDALSVLREIVIKATYLLPGEEFGVEKSPEDFIILNSALKVGEDETYASTGYSFIIEAMGKRRKTLLVDAIRAIEREIKDMYNIGQITNKELFTWYMDKNSKGELTQAVVTVYPPANI